ncbi:hypothetical protein QJQ45_019912 [Haematococcus lacustris]|nr:hypothetical protein QJQ45_019912 [Haematococcus lacustris]
MSLGPIAALHRIPTTAEAQEHGGAERKGFTAEQAEERSAALERQLKAQQRAAGAAQELARGMQVALEQQQSTALALAAANHSLEVRLQRQEAAQRDSQLLSERLEAKVAALEQQLQVALAPKQQPAVVADTSPKDEDSASHCCLVHKSAT